MEKKLWKKFKNENGEDENKTKIKWKKKIKWARLKSEKINKSNKRKYSKSKIKEINYMSVLGHRKDLTERSSKVIKFSQIKKLLLFFKISLNKALQYE